MKDLVAKIRELCDNTSAIVVTDKECIASLMERIEENEDLRASIHVLKLEEKKEENERRPMYNMSSSDVEIIVSQTTATPEQAEAALKRHNGSVVDAIMELQ